jgi:hypothetical protein|tara:strand:- start:3266 stop:3517 length:252 start_codon:yes stop_codon:yes gene_type:complete
MKQTFKEIIDTSLTLGTFPVSSKVFALGREAENIANLAQGKIDEDGEFATIHCSNIVNWMNEIAEQAQAVLDLQMKKGEEVSK